MYSLKSILATCSGVLTEGMVINSQLYLLCVIVTDIQDSLVYRWEGGGGVGYLKPLGALGLLLRWQVHLVLHCTGEAQLGRNSCIFGTIILKFHPACNVHVAITVVCQIRSLM